MRNVPFFGGGGGGGGLRGRGTGICSGGKEAGSAKVRGKAGTGGEGTAARDDMTQAAYATYIALNRFGLGARPGDAEAVAGDPVGWLHRQIEQPPALSPVPVPEGVFARIAAQNRAGASDKREEQAIYTQTVGARMAATIASDTPFYERWAGFWTNHFTVSITNRSVTALAAAYEQEAIRPNVYGRFIDMLLATARHPAMLYYLDNVTSIGPYSRDGFRHKSGLNENYAREILELHTLGVDGGYTQNDVEELAKMLTGWTVGEDGRFEFVLERHQPREKQFLGRTYEWTGEDEAERAFRTLAAHPSTARFVAGKLARHFVADRPPDAAVERLAAVYRDSGGDLGALAHAVVDLEAAWQPEQRKMRRAQEYLVAALRAVGVPFEPAELPAWATSLGQQPFAAPAPDGWSDEAEDWLGPRALDERLKFAFLLAGRYEGGERPDRLAEAVLGPFLSGHSRELIASAASQQDGVALLLASPEFQRR